MPQESEKWTAMACRFTSLSFPSTTRITKPRPLSPLLLPTCFTSARKRPISINYNAFKLSTSRYLLVPFDFYSMFSMCGSESAFCRVGKMVSAVVSEESAVGSSFSGTDAFKLTYLEVSFWFSWLIVFSFLFLIGFSYFGNLWLNFLINFGIGK